MTTSQQGSADMWWIIIGAVIALVVLIVLLVLFVGKTNSLEQGLSSCTGKGGKCSSVGSCPDGKLPTNAFTCAAGEECCIGITSPS